MASKSYAKISPRLAKKQPFFDFFSIFSKTVRTIRKNISTVILRHIMVLCVQGHQNGMTRIRASQKEKDQSRLLYHTCGSGTIYLENKQSSVVDKRGANTNFVSLAGAIVSATLSSSANERMFSTLGLTYCKLTGKLKVENAEKLAFVFTQVNL